MTYSPPPDADITRDHFLGGQVVLLQPRQGYRAGVDAVLLAAACPAAPGQSVLDLGCGVGAVALCLAARVEALRLCGVECQADLVDLAGQNGRINAADFSPYCADITALPGAVRQQQFHHVVANPPYFSGGAIASIANPVRDQAHREHTDLGAWFDVAARRLKPRGSFTMIQRIERLPEILQAAARSRLGAVRALPIAGRAGRAPDRVIVQVHKDRNTPFCLRPTLHLHRESAHAADRPDYTKEVDAVLRDAASLCDWV